MKTQRQSMATGQVKIVALLQTTFSRTILEKRTAHGKLGRTRSHFGETGLKENPSDKTTTSE